MTGQHDALAAAQVVRATRSCRSGRLEVGHGGSAASMASQMVCSLLLTDSMSHSAVVGDDVGREVKDRGCRRAVVMRASLSTSRSRAGHPPRLGWPP